jgi:hypothetical protein
VDTALGLRLERGTVTVSASFLQADLADGDFARILEGADLVTAAALFDLVSQTVIERLADAVAAAGQVSYTVLTYDGTAAWTPEHPADPAMLNAFNHHQRGEKGFGPAAGPAATDMLAAAFARSGYTVIRGKSPWVLDDSFADLRRGLDQGWAAAVRETGLVPQGVVNEWLEYRLAGSAAVTTVGHEDLLALPPAALRN